MTQNSVSASSSASSTPAPKSGVKRYWLLAVLALTFLFILMPFLFWQATWFGRPLDDDQLARALHDTQSSRDQQHALSEIADRIIATDPAMHASARPFYPDVLRIAKTGNDDLRPIAAWVMGQDNTVPEFGSELRALLADPNPMVRRNAALALIRFGDISGRGEILAIFQPYAVTAPQAGTVDERLKAGDTVGPDTLLGRIKVNGQYVEIRPLVPGALKQWLIPNGQPVAVSQPLVLMDPSADEVWEALRGLYLIGEVQDLPLLQHMADDQTQPDNLREQAKRTIAAIKSRTSAPGKSADTPPAAK